VSSANRVLVFKMADWRKHRLFDMTRILRSTPDLKSLPVTLKKTKNKGIGLFAVRDIPAKAFVALYRMKVFDKRDYDSPTDYKYSFVAYTKSGNASRTFIADLDMDEPLLMPRLELDNRAIDGSVYLPYWAYFANEPTRGVQEDNVEMDTNPDENYSSRDRLRVGDHIVYKMKTTRPIKAGEELVWSYGDLYERDY